MKRYSWDVSASIVKASETGRVVSYIFSDSAVARDNHTISNAGWDVSAFLKNPVFLWAHDGTQPPIGRVIEIGVTRAGLVGTVEYIEADVYPFADTVYQLVRGGYLNAVSVCWNPLEYRYSNDKTRPGGIDFIKQELLEVSQVPVPALPGALATARARGIDTRPLARWAEGALSRGATPAPLRRTIETLAKEAQAAPRRTAFASIPGTVQERMLEATSIKTRVEKMLSQHDIKMQNYEVERREKAARGKELSTLEGRIRDAEQMRTKNRF